MVPSRGRRLREGPRSVHRRSTPALLFGVLTLLAPAASSGQTLLGGEFQVNSYTTDSQRYGAVAAQSDGSFVVVWMSEHQGSSSYDIFVRRFTSAGAAIGFELQVNSFSTARQAEPAVAVRAGGDFVVVWHSGGAQDGSGYGVFARRFSSAGAALGSEFQVNTSTQNSQRYPVLAFLPSGEFVVVWDTNDVSGLDYDVIARRFSSTGTPLTDEILVNTFTGGRQHNGEVAAAANGSFVVAWKGLDYGSNYGVLAQRFSSLGSHLGTEFHVNTHTANGQTDPMVAVAPSGESVVVWNSDQQDGSQSGVFAQRFSSAGTPVASELQINESTVESQQHPAITAGGNGDFVVAWDGERPDGGYDTFVRPFSSAGVATSGEFQLSTYTGTARYPVPVRTAAGRYVVVWQHEDDHDGSGTGLFAQRFLLPVIMDVDGDGVVEPLTDGVLILRFLFGFAGNVLVDGAVNLDGCTRCDAPTIEAYLNTLN